MHMGRVALPISLPSSALPPVENWMLQCRGLDMEYPYMQIPWISQIDSTCFSTNLYNILGKWYGDALLCHKSPLLHENCGNRSAALTYLGMRSGGAGATQLEDDATIHCPTSHATCKTYQQNLLSYPPGMTPLVAFTRVLRVREVKCGLFVPQNASERT